MIKNKDEILRISWDEFEKNCYQLADQINHHIDIIVAIPRGGLVPAVKLAHILDIKSVVSINEWMFEMDYGHHLDYPELQVLIIDDICDTGTQFINTVGNYNFDNQKVYTATPYLRQNSKFIPTYYSKLLSHKKWLRFPWEN